jgi:phosphoribosylglycinamide formyltransferase 1
MVKSDPHEGAPRPRVAILISGRGSNMAALIKAAKAEDFPAEIAVVISNRADAMGLALAGITVGA